jgi:hypothetical protein
VAYDAFKFPKFDALNTRWRLVNREEEFDRPALPQQIADFPFPFFRQASCKQDRGL